MNKILVPTDFSEISQETLLYAFRFAEKHEKSLHIVHVLELYQYAAGTTESDLLSSILPPENITEMEKNALEILKKQINTVVSTHNLKVHHDFKVLPGHLVNDIIAESIAADCELLILPITEKGSQVTRFSHRAVTSIINDSIVPVLAVKHPKFEPFKCLVYATDFKRTDIYALKHLSKLFENSDNQIIVTHINTKKDDFKTELLFEGFKNRVNAEIPDKNIVFESLYDKSIINGIISTVCQNNADGVVMLKDNESIFSSLFETSNTEKLVHSIEIPMIIYHNQHPQEIYK